MNTPSSSENRERAVTVLSGWLVLPVHILLLLAAVALLIYSIIAGVREYDHPIWTWFVLALLMLPVWIILLFGYFTLQPNEARVLILFGKYKGTVRESGFHWGNPFYSNGPRGHANRFKLSLRARTLNGDKLKVNDKRGNPIEIALIVIWRVHDTAQASFDIDHYEEFVETQSESSLRHLATAYAYDHGEEDEMTLRANVEEISDSLRETLQHRLAKAGVVVEEARLTHLAYAPEIAQAMLRRQQAEAIIAARRKIVHGAVSMVEMALEEITEKKVLELNEERKASMVSNLLVVLCGESEVNPVINTGTLYQ